MSNAVQFLESLGSNPALTRLSAAEYAATVAALNVDDAQRQALLDRDIDALNGLLGGRVQMLCLIMNPEEQPVRKDDDEEEAPSEDTPEQE